VTVSQRYVQPSPEAVLYRRNESGNWRMSYTINGKQASFAENSKRRTRLPQAQPLDSET
jgi:hypothetical protein